MIKAAIQKIVENQNLTEREMISVMEQIMEGRATNAQIASFITALRMKGETVEEITGAARVMREKAIAIPVTKSGNLVDIVGTGGDMSNTFNISTAAAFVSCGAGLTIAKHGNRSVSSRSGSADVMQQLGIEIDLTPEQVARCIDDVGIGFLFAQNLHKAMKYAAPARKETGIRTIYNILGPLTNPADADMLLVGVYNKAYTEIIASVLNNLGKKRALVVHGLDGLDEITVCGPTKISDLKDGTISTSTIHPEEFGFEIRNLRDIQGGTPEDNAIIINNILKGDRGPGRDIVLLNAGAAIMVSGMAENIKEGIELAKESIDSGKATEKLLQLRELTQEFSAL